MLGNVEKIKNKTKNVIIYALFILSVIINIALFVHNINYEPEEIVKEKIIVKTDTVVKVEYKEIEVPKEKIKYVDIIKLDTLHLHDTIFIKEQINYRDSFASIWCSGYRPAIDSIHYTIPEKTIYVDKVIEVPKKDSFWKNRFVITAGFSAQYGLIYRNFDVGPYVGVGIRLY